ncbi:M23 family metallopeptidase [Aromatoleum sp.]|uniref:M23 family metallopeptidase n=1 Tax=Aromatoleum sp. TaxID=2307007 RepID=UPI002FCB394E
MAFVILSAGTLTQSKMRTFSVRTFLGVALGVLLTTLAAGFALGYGITSQAMKDSGTVVIGTVSVDPQHPEGRLLIDRFGELSGRMVQLEAEAANLAARIGAIKEFEARINEDVADAAKAGRVAKTPLATSAGGPLLAPVGVPQAVPARPRLTEPVPAGPSPDGADSEIADPLSDGLSQLERDVGRLGLKFARIDKAATEYKLAQMFFPGRAPVSDVDISSTFGNRIDPFRKRSAFHSGVDYPSPRGTPITASAGGRVTFAGYRAEYGNTVEIDHGGGLATRYAHASKLHVKVGQVVMPGQRVADVGSTGRSTGPHLHFEIFKDDFVVDPAFYLARF